MTNQVQQQKKKLSSMKILTLRANFEGWVILAWKGAHHSCYKEGEKLVLRYEKFQIGLIESHGSCPPAFLKLTSEILWEITRFAVE